MKLFTIPNFLTLGNLFCGCLAILFLTEQLDYSSLSNTIFILLFVSLVCDLLDGMIARALKINSSIGIQLDSLADMVSFGFVPGIIMFQLIDNSSINNHDMPYGKFFGLIIILFSALRLAKFNIDSEQTTYFKGLNTPANTILIFSLFWIKIQNGYLVNTYVDKLLLIGITILSCYLLVSNIPMFSFKFKGFAWKDNHYKYVFVLVSLILLILFQMNAVPFIILIYIITSIIFRKKIVNVA